MVSKVLFKVFDSIFSKLFLNIKKRLQNKKKQEIWADAHETRESL